MPKKLLIFIPSIEDGGVEKNLYIICNYLSKYILNIDLLTTSFDKKKFFSSKINFFGPRLFWILDKGRYIKYFISLLYLVKYITTNRRNLLIFSFQANIFAILMSKIFFVKIITRSNSSPSGWSKNYFKNIIFKFLLRNADKIIVNSLSFKKEFLKKFQIKTICIYNPFVKSDVRINSNKKIKFDFFKKKNLKIINVGRLTDQKDQLTILKSFLLIKKELNPKLIIIGKGYMHDKILQFIKFNKLHKKVKLLGYSNNPHFFIKKSDIFVLSSKFEGLPNVLIEAQFLKKYIISSDCPTGPKEILLSGKAGDLFKVGNTVQLSKLINNYKKKNLNKKIQIGYKNLNRFDYEKNCKKYLYLIKKYL